MVSLSSTTAKNKHTPAAPIHPTVKRALFRLQGRRCSNLTALSLRLWLSCYYTDKDLVKHVTALTGARKAAMAANSKFLSTAVSPRPTCLFCSR